ncbi:MAG TPA: cupin domain-containing protein [Actinomycetota bacterium]|nr:cupin domain-containing protein [Actinomycetota bacterium]
MATTEDTRITVIGSGGRDGWATLVDPPGAIPSTGAERSAFTSIDGAFTTGLWEREPDTWEFERPYDEVALILSGAAEIEEPDGTVHRLAPGDVLVTPKGSRGTWRITETIVKFFAIYER